MKNKKDPYGASMDETRFNIVFFLEITTFVTSLQSTLLLKKKCLDTNIYMKPECLQTNKTQHLLGREIP